MNKKYIAGGVIGGLASGVVFGLVSQATGMMPTIAMLVRSQSVPVGWTVHLTLSVLGGIVFAAVFGRLAHTYSKGAAWGLLYGVAWWFFGMLIAMPLLLGMPAEVTTAFNQMNLMSLYGHLAWGLLLGLVFVLYARENVAVAPKEIWKSTWPFVAMLALLLLNGSTVPAGGSSMMMQAASSMQDTGSDMMGTAVPGSMNSMDTGSSATQTESSMMQTH